MSVNQVLGQSFGFTWDTWPGSCNGGGGSEEDASRRLLIMHAGPLRWWPRSDLEGGIEERERLDLGDGFVDRPQQQWLLGIETCCGFNRARPVEWKQIGGS